MLSWAVAGLILAVLSGEMGNDASIEIGAIKKTQLAEVRMRLLSHKPGSERA
jgi:hypothetical protein